jgi:hypothetical protein
MIAPIPTPDSSESPIKLNATTLARTEAPIESEYGAAIKV